MCLRLRLRVMHECAWRWVRRWLSFTVAWGWADRCRDELWFPVSSTSNLPCDTTATWRLCIEPRPWNSAKNYIKIHLLQGQFCEKDGLNLCFLFWMRQITSYSEVQWNWSQTIIDRTLKWVKVWDLSLNKFFFWVFFL